MNVDQLVAAMIKSIKSVELADTFIMFQKNVWQCQTSKAWPGMSFCSLAWQRLPMAMAHDVPAAFAAASGCGMAETTADFNSSLRLPPPPLAVGQLTEVQLQLRRCCRNSTAVDAVNP